MLLLQALRHRSISLLWSGQVFSAIGDEVYRVAFLWLAIGFIGKETGYLAASQMLSLLIVCLFGGKWAEHWDNFRTLIWVDLARAVIVLFPFIFSLFHPLSLPVLWITGVLLSGINGFFEPALQGLLPLYCPDKRTLQAANGLMSTTMRLARVFAPLVIAGLTAITTTDHFFPITSLTFLISAFSVLLVFRMPVLKKHAPILKERQGLKDSMMDGIRATKREPVMLRAMVVRALSGGAWNLGFSLGIALLVKERFAGDIEAFGWAMGGYGAGNLASALFFGSRERRVPERLLYSGHMWLGVGFVLIATAPSLPYLICACAFTAFGGPMNDLPLTDLVQSLYPLHEVPKIFRLRMAAETAFALFSLGSAPLLFSAFSKGTVLAAIGIFILGLGFYGYRRATPA